MSRVDKNEHTLAAAPRMGYMVALHEVFVLDTQTFATTDLSPERAARRLQRLYNTKYPARFRKGNVTFNADLLPVGTARFKQKCHGPDGRVCTRPGHNCLRTVVDTSKLPARETDRLFVRAWTVAAMEDVVTAFELWKLKDLRERFFATRQALAAPPVFRKECARCHEEKSVYANIRCDVGAMFNWARMSEVSAEGPQILRRHRQARQVQAVTVQHGRAFLCGMGGHTAGTFRRDVVAFPKML
jgi:hypothetical protein